MYQPSKPVGGPSAAQHGPQPDPGAAARRVYNHTAGASRGATAAYGSQLQPVADPNCKLVGYKLGFQDTGRLCLGWIVDGTAIANCYRVQVEKGRAPVVAIATTSTSNSCFGATEINGYTPGTAVVLMIHDKVETALILGSAPTVLDVAYRGFHDYISQASRKRVDDAHKKYLKLPDSGQMVDASAWRPIDATLAGEWGAITTTGIRVTLDDFMAQFSVNEFTGVFGFYHDSMLRVAGYNMQVWTGGSERDSYVDQGECNDTQGYAPFPWEAMGVLQPGTEMIQEYGASTYLNSKGRPYYAHFENKHEYQQPYHRTQVFMGYLGQGGRRVVHAPPENVIRWTYKPADNPGTPGEVFDSTVQSATGTPQQANPGSSKLTDFDEKPAVGLFEENTGLDGRHFIASAKGITIAKRMLLPQPTRLKRPEAGDGDDASTNYKAASKHGEGPEHDITGDLATSGDFPNLQRASGVMDLHAYLFNYSGLHPFHWHAKDFKTWEQSELTYADCNQVVPDYNDLKGSMYLKQPDPKRIKIDHRYVQQDYFETEAFMSLLEDGSVVIGDGYGGEIRMSGGCVTISAPGDVWIKSGRHTQTWAGGDVIQRANGSVDISTTEKSVRIKAEKDVMVLAGNSENTGGVLIESRAKAEDYDFEQAGDDVKFGGVVLRAASGNVVSMAHQIYMRSGGGDSDIKPGNITIDAGRGEADLVTKSNQLFHYVGESGDICHFFRDSADSNTKKANYFSRDFTMLAGPLSVDAAGFFQGSLIANGSVIAAKGGVLASQGAPFIAPCDGGCQGQVNSALDTLRQYADDILPNKADSVDETYLNGLWYDDNKPGNARVMNIMEFSFRTDEQYKVPDFMLYEDRWQQMARIGDKIPERWTEKPVQSKIIGETYPFPGKAKLTEEDVFATQDLTLVEQTSGGLRDKNRNSGSGDVADEYKAPYFNDSQKQKINGAYPIIGSSK
jgi:hypothetical protein